MIKHSKLRNTGLIFELLVRQITSDILLDKDSKSTNILKKYFVKTELGKEYKLYETLTNRKNRAGDKSELIIESVIESSKNLNRGMLKKQKYNLIKEISDNYNIEEFFRTKVPNYKMLASLYTILEIYNSNESVSPEQIISNKNILLEYLSIKPSVEPSNSVQMMDEFITNDKDTRILTHKILFEKFNDKYNSLNKVQKSILREYVNLIDNPIKLKLFYNETISKIKNSLLESNKKIQDQTIQIKINEISKLLVELKKGENINDNHLVNLLQYGDLIQEIKSIK